MEFSRKPIENDIVYVQNVTNRSKQPKSFSGGVTMDAVEKLQQFYNMCNRLPEVITRESIIRNMYDRGDKLAIRESLDAGALTDEALGVLRKLKFTYEEIGVLFDEKASTLRQRSRRLKARS